MIIVTGGAGFIGSNLVKGLNEQGYNNILIVDDLDTGEKFKNLIGLRYLDYRHKDDFIREIEEGVYNGSNIEAVFHQGACSDTMEYDCNYMMETNYDYSKRLLHFCLDHRIAFFYASSASTYGNGKNGFREEDGCESALNIYAFSKLAFDRYVRQVLPSAKSQVVGLKYFNVYGPQEQHKGKMASIVYQFYQQIRENGYVKLFKGIEGYGDGEQLRDFIYVKDLVKINLWFWKTGAASGVYNCGTGQASTFNAVAQAVVSYFGKGHIEYVDFPEVLKGKYQSYTQADLTKLLAVGYNEGFHPLEKAVHEYCQFIDNGGYYTYE
ncbi:UDP-glucose 4-epimerase [Sporomusaceae bacterium FL31]|nr:UDP-glucose 4-epimerase [Sporomusaceae bacterium FL31]GCE33917.1 UDP-glucose 4-epimerase [Sporomusaceae bacterium]